VALTARHAEIDATDDLGTPEILGDTDQLESGRAHARPPARAAAMPALNA